MTNKCTQHFTAMNKKSPVRMFIMDFDLRMFQTWNAQTWNVSDLECFRLGMFQTLTLECFRLGMFQTWNVSDFDLGMFQTLTLEYFRL